MDLKGITNLEVYQCNYKWIINNFKFWGLIINNPKELLSPTFTLTTGKNKKSVWCLKLCQSADFGLYLKLVSSDEESVYANFKISILNDKDEKIHIFEYPGYRFEQPSAANPKIGYGWCNFKIDKNILALKIFCQVSVLGDILHQPSRMQFKVPDCQLSKDLGMIFETKEFSDATLLVADGREFQVHTTILAARSPVFAAMFKHDMEERKQNCVKIIDVDYEVLHEVLKFIYTGNAENLETMAAEILAAAEKYALERLKVLCEEELCKNLSVENAAEMLILSDLHRADQLKATSINFISTSPDVMDTVGWKQLIKTHPILISNVCKTLATVKLQQQNT
ncbi:protein roadkill-like [Chrysoperla carnea]|uniref:protein roadkill-like n=1 Tax=Chrysoperla carnea TaxID=189513 RepID=UPI001D05E7D3|nr:protein roadkill-like [Chrysoperla carnea]